MKTNYVFLLGLSSCFIWTSLQAQTCTPSPDCNSLGYTQTSTDCNGMLSVKCPFDINKMFCMEKTVVCEEGAILYSDKSCSKTVESGKTPIGVVFDTKKRLAVSLQPDKYLNWGEANVPSFAICTDVEFFMCGPDGKVNTSSLIEVGMRNGVSYPAAEYCNSYTTAGTKAGDWFLPSYAEFLSLYNAKTHVNASLRLLSKPALADDSNYYWSSTEAGDINAWVFFLSNGTTGNGSKDGRGFVRPVMAF